MLAVVETHPIQYHAPVYRTLQQRCGVPVTVIYGSDFSVSGYLDAEFGATFSWDTDLLSGYTTMFLSRVESGGAPTADAVSAGGLRTALRRLNPRAVLIVGYSPSFHRVAWLEAWRSGTPVLFRGETADHSAGNGGLRSQVKRRALALAYRTCATLLFIGQRSEMHFRQLGVDRERMEFSPYCVDVTPFEIDDAARERLRPAARRELGIADDRVVVMFSGKLSQRKGVDLLLPAVQALPDADRAKMAVVFLGDGAMRQHLEAQAAREPSLPVVFAGFHNQRTLSRFYHAADLLVLPSRHSETWGLVVNEALHHGLPCVVSDRVGCQPDLIEGRTGRVFESDSVASLTAALESARELVGRPDIREACREKVAHYSIERAAEGIARAYASACARPEPRR